jgi:hypothetical protein
MGYKNAFDLPRDALLTHIERLRAHIFGKGSARQEDEGTLTCLAGGGTYLEYQMPSITSLCRSWATTRRP